MIRTYAIFERKRSILVLFCFLMAVRRDIRSSSTQHSSSKNKTFSYIVHCGPESQEPQDPANADKHIFYTFLVYRPSSPEVFLTVNFLVLCPQTLLLPGIIVVHMEMGSLHCMCVFRLAKVARQSPIKRLFRLLQTGTHQPVLTLDVTSRLKRLPSYSSPTFSYYSLRQVSQRVFDSDHESQGESFFTEFTLPYYSYRSFDTLQSFPTSCVYCEACRT